MTLLRRSRSLAVCLAVFGSLLSLNSQASTPQFPTLSQGDFDNVIREMSANGLLHTVTPPSSYGSIFGFELGLVGGATRTPDIDALVKQASADAETKYLPHAGLLGAVSIPFGITGEALLVPKTEVSGVKYQQYALALKWNADTLLPVSPVNIALRGFLSKTEMSFDQTLSGVNSTIKYDGTVTGLHVFVSPKLIPVIEPYAGIGFVSATGKLNASAGNLFNFTASQEAESSPTSTHIIIGADVRLLLIGFGLEYNRAFGTDSYTGKLSLKF